MSAFSQYQSALNTAHERLNGWRESGWNLRRIFPVISLSATSILALTVANLFEPKVTYDYLNEGQIITESLPVSNWVDADDVAFSANLSMTDKVQLADMLEQFDRQPFEASLDLLRMSDAVPDLPLMVCPEGQVICELSIPLLRQLTPDYVHGAMRFISLQETLLLLKARINQVTGEWETEPAKTHVRQARFRQTQSGWYMTNLETVAETSSGLTKSEMPPVFGAEKLKYKRYSGVNYYPASASWGEFWTEFPKSEVQDDFAKLQDLGANSIRVFLTHAHFSDNDRQDEMIGKLDWLLQTAQAHDLDVIVTTFDLRPNYDLANWAYDAAYIQKLVARIGEHPALIAIDLKNQVDLDFDSYGRSHVVSWLEAMIYAVRYENPCVAVTIGWSDPQHADTLSSKVDVVSYHDYQNPRGFAQRLDDVKSRIGNTPVMVTEIGHSRWLHPLSQNREAAQARRLAMQLAAIDESVSGVFLWTLNDFDHVGSDVVGPLPWRKKQQAHYGILTDDGARRPAAEVFATFNADFLTPKGLRK